jgi:thioredoxin reductase (NADPH)
MKSYDALVIGGGPAGMTAALYLLRSGRSLAWVEPFAPGGQVLSTERIDNYPGFPQGLMGFELADRFAEHLKSFSFDTYGEQVDALEPGAKKHLVQVGGQWLAARSVIVCTGAKWRSLGVPGEMRFTGKGVSYCAVCDGNFYRDQVVACIGGGDSALEESLYLAKIVRKIHLIHRRDEFRAVKLYRDKVLAEPKIEIHYNNVVRAFQGDEGLSSLLLENVQDGTQSELDVDGAFVFVGHDPQAGFLPGEVHCDDCGFVITDTEMRTNIPGIFAAGDIRSKLCRQVSTAVGDGATAANSASIYLESLDD